MMASWRLATFCPPAASLPVPALRRMTGHAAFDNHPRARANHAPHIPLTFRAIRNRHVIDTVKPLETIAAFLALIVIRWHIFSSWADCQILQTCLTAFLFKHSDVPDKHVLNEPDASAAAENFQLRLARCVQRLPNMSPCLTLAAAPTPALRCPA